MNFEAEFAKIKGNPTYFIEQYCVIRHPSHGVVPFLLWDWQRDVLGVFQREKRVIILKSRQLGASELAAAYALWMARFTPAAQIALLSRNQRDANDLLERIYFTHEHLPNWLRAALAKQEESGAADGVTLLRHSGRILEFGHTVIANGASLGKRKRVVSSRIESFPAARGAVRSRAVSLIVLDEWAHQPWQEEIWTAIEPAVSAGGQIIGISTAHGVGNVFYRIWQKSHPAYIVGGLTGAQAASSPVLGAFAAIFLPWNANPERSEQWRQERMAVMEPWQMSQEYPETAVEAFVQSGRPVFDREILARCEPAMALLPSPQEIEDGVRIWEEQQSGHCYVIGADTAEGLSDGDYDAACVVDMQTGRQCAAIYGRWPPDIFAAKLARLGALYGGALLAVERNQHGFAVLLALKTAGYEHLYYYSDPIRDVAQEESRPGWPTNTRTKPLMIAHLARCLREQSYVPADRQFLHEALVYSYRADGSTGAPAGFHDDIVIAHAIALSAAAQPNAAAAAVRMFEVVTNLDGAVE